MRMHELPTEKALGVYWKTSTDCFQVKVSIKKACTRSLMLVISQVYDVLGLVQPFILPARKLLQEACQDQLAWNEPLIEAQK